MKKYIAILSLAALALTATTAFAHENEGEEGLGLKTKLEAQAEGKVIKGPGLHLGWFKHLDADVDESRFVLAGTVTGKTATTLTVTVKGEVHASSVIGNNQATVTVASDAKIVADKNKTIALADIQTGSQVVISGTISGSTLTANKVHVILPRGKAFGEVTAKTDTSITVKNNVTGVSQTFTTNGDTKVNIDGEAKTTVDIQVGDRGFVKFRTEISGVIAKFIALFR